MVGEGAAEIVSALTGDELAGRHAEIGEDQVRVVVLGAGFAEEDVVRFDIAVDDGLPRGGHRGFGIRGAIAVLQEGEGFRELDIGVPDEALRDFLAMIGRVIFDQHGQVTAVAVFQVVHRLLGLPGPEIELDDARGLRGEDVHKDHGFFGFLAAVVDLDARFH